MSDQVDVVVPYLDPFSLLLFLNVRMKSCYHAGASPASESQVEEWKCFLTKGCSVATEGILGIVLVWSENVINYKVVI